MRYPPGTLFYEIHFTEHTAFCVGEFKTILRKAGFDMSRPIARIDRPRCIVFIQQPEGEVCEP